MTIPICMSCSRPTGLMTKRSNPYVLEQRLVSLGLGRTPHANRDAVKVVCCPNLVQDFLAGVFGRFQSIRIKFGTGAAA